MAKSTKSKKELRKSYKKRVYYYCLTAILCVCILQFLGSSLYNVTRYVVLNKKSVELEMLNRESVEKNKLLKTQLKVYSSYEGVEELARNNLKMVGKDEVLVLIKNKD